MLMWQNPLTSFQRIRPMRKLALIIIASSIALSGCATVKGLGKDIQSVGQTGQDVIHGK
jgi:predicted small secreted protein